MVTVAFFFLSPAKRSVYVLQMIPALALPVGGGLNRFGRFRRPSERWIIVPAALLALVLIPGAEIVVRLGPTRPEASVLPSDLPLQMAAVLSFLAVTAAVPAWSASRRQILASVGVLATGFGVGALGALWWLLPTLDPVKSVRPVARRFVQLEGPKEPYGIHPGLEPALSTRNDSGRSWRRRGSSGSSWRERNGRGSSQNGTTCDVWIVR